MKLKVLNLPDYVKCLIRKEFEQPELQIVGIGYDTFISVKSIENFLASCYNLFIFENLHISNNFISLRKDIQKTLDSTLCPNDKVFGEFILNHYLHKLYSEIGPAVGKQNSTFYYLMTKPGYKLLLKILNDKISNDLDKDSNKKIDGFCNHKLKYYHNIMKFLRTNLSLDEIQFKNYHGQWVNFPISFVHTYKLPTGDKPRVITPKIVLDSGNDAQTLVGVALVEHLGLIPKITKCTSAKECGGIGGITRYEDKIYMDVRIPYFNKIFKIKCLIEHNPDAQVFNTFLMGWNKILTEMAEQGFGVYGQK